MAWLYLILYVLALLCFLGAAFGATLRTINLIALGLAFWVVVAVIISFKAATGV